MTPRLDYKEQAPRLAAAMNRLDGTVELGPPLRELANLRASQINAYNRLAIATRMDVGGYRAGA